MHIWFIHWQACIWAEKNIYLQELGSTSYSCAVRYLCVHCTSVMNSKTNIHIDNAVAVMLSPAPGECKHALGWSHESIQLQQQVTTACISFDHTATTYICIYHMCMHAHKGSNESKQFSDQWFRKKWTLSIQQWLVKNYKLTYLVTQIGLQLDAGGVTRGGGGPEEVGPSDGVGDKRGLD